MAQAARLNLRMQKELKLLLTEPPPGVSLPSLCSSSSSSSFTSIDALLQGPECTVYANGVFKIKIQIPERYPFQPPIVTFATPIYHPNIDTGGRICLDILNLPPKGTWQPSLNISTVLTSIGLLLTEPNPDDGLMHEASREYKYNRQAFDQKARSMTEIHARAPESESSQGSHGIQTHTFPSTPQSLQNEVQAKLPTIGSSKLSLESLGSSSYGDNEKGIEELPAYGNSKNSTEISRLKRAIECNKNPEKQPTRHRLSLKVSVVSNSRNGENAKIHPPAQCSNLLESKGPPLPFAQVDDMPKNVSPRNKDGMDGICTRKLSLTYVKTNQWRDSSEKVDCIPQQPFDAQMASCMSHESLLSSLNKNVQNKINPPEDATHKNEIYPAAARHKNVGSVESIGTSRPFGCSGSLLEDEVDELPKIQCGTSKLTEKTAPPSSADCQLLHVTTNDMSDQKNHISHCNEESDGNFKLAPGDSPIPEYAIVFDSEDSGEEIVPARSKLSLSRKPLRKRKSNI